MSDNEDFLVDDLGDHCIDDTYNLGNEEEEILLAGGSISDSLSRNKVSSENVSNEIETLRESHVSQSDESKDIIRDTTKGNFNDEKSFAINETQSNEIATQGSSLSEKEIGESKIATEKILKDQRYRDNQKERFPTERSETRATPPTTIPDSLDTIVTSEASNQFENRKNGNRGRRQGSQKTSMTNLKDVRRPDNFPSSYFRKYPHANTNRNLKPMPSSYRPENVDPTNPRYFRGNEMRPNGNIRTVGNMPIEIGNMRPNNMRISVDLRPDARPIVNAPFNNRYEVHNFPPRNFNQTVADMGNIPDNSQIPFNDRQNFSSPPNTFQPNIQSHIPGNIIHNVDHPLNDRPPITNAPYENFMNYQPPYSVRDSSDIKSGLSNERDFGFDEYSSKLPYAEHTFKSIPPLSEGKKVLINPHFKGSVPVSQVLGNIEFLKEQGKLVGDNLPGSSNLSNKLHNIINSNQKLSDKELEHMAEQFINEQRRCLQRKKAAAEDEDFYEKTQRFIENTTIEPRNLLNDEDRDSRKEYLKRKQEEFINENRLNLRRRRVSPVHHRSPPPYRHKNLPYQKPRPRSSHSPIQNKRESSGEPEDRDYRAKLREQAEMRAKVLQAKERRRRRDAANLSEKLNQNLESQSQTNTEALVTSTTSSSIPSKNEEYAPNTKDSSGFVAFEKYSITDFKTPSLHVNESIIQRKSDENKISSASIENEPLDDLLEDDLLCLSPEDEDLLLSDEDEMSFKKNDGTNKIRNLNLPVKPNQGSTSSTKSLVKDSKFVSKKDSQNSGKLNTLKRQSNENAEDLRKKLSKTSTQSTSNSTVTSPRRKIIFSNDDLEKTNKNKIKDSDDKKGDKNKESENTKSKWKSTFSEQKLDLTAPVAARAISAVMRNSETSTRKVIAPKNNKLTPNIPSTEVQEKEKSDKIPNVASNDKTSWNGRQVVVGAASRRVVIPPRPQKPLVVIENDEDDIEEEYNSVRSDVSKSSASITGLPPGMTEARLLSLCGPEVEHLIVGSGDSAKVTFNSIEACQRFIRRFNGRIVAACRLSVTAAK